MKASEKMIQDSALKYQTRAGWSNGDPKMFDAAMRSGKDLDMYCQHMGR